VVDLMGMSNAPSVLLLDDDELDHVHRMLKRIGADYVRLQGHKIGRSVEKPRDLLISSCQRTLEMPRLKSPAGVHLDPVWVCVHSQDFLPLRERLKDLGVHFLVHSALDAESLRLFLLQLLYRGPNRRAQPRLPLGDTIRYALANGPLQPAKLAVLSSDMCRILSTQPAEPEAAVNIVLPESLGGREGLELQGHVVRCAECEARSGERAFSLVVRLASIEAEAQAQVERLVRGEQIGTRVTPLAERATHAQEPHAPEACDEAQQPSRDEAHQPPATMETAPEVERRRHSRRDYDRRVLVLDFDDSGASHAAMGHDLSLEGVRIVGAPDLAVGSAATLALYGGEREEPVVVEATVLRDDGAAGVTFTFRSLSESQQRGVEKLLEGVAHLESLRDDSRDRDGVVLAQVNGGRS
jgi:hypothetical protein